MRKWNHLMIEIYQPDGYQGRWDVENGEIGLDLDYIKSCVTSLRRDERYKDATLRFIEDGDDLVIGVFCGSEPPEQSKSGNALPPEMFEEAD